MTVSYQYEVASSTSGGFTRLLFMWKGSLYKLIYRELLLFLLAFGILSALYRNLFTVDQKRYVTESTRLWCTLLDAPPPPPILRLGSAAMRTPPRSFSRV